jgi:hypothetical protein
MYFLVLSVVFSLRYVFAFLIRFKDEDPKPMEVNKISEVLLYLESAYIITYLIVI